jgi:uncharacterized protein YydD (DUF2326 family)
MRLVKLTIVRGDAVVREIEFKTGLNLILDKPISKSTRSGNNVGKTTVLRLIDFCFGSEGDDIWQDPEFSSNINRAVYDYLHGALPVSVELVIEGTSKRQHSLSRIFKHGRPDRTSLQIDGIAYRNLTEYRVAVKQLLFKSGGSKPSLRQLSPKFVRSSQAVMSRTLRFLGDYAREADYEAVHLFLFGFFNVDVLEVRPRLVSLRKKIARDLEAVTRVRKEGEIEQLLLHLRREIEQLSLSDHLRHEVPELAARADAVARIRASASQVAGELARIEGEIASGETAIQQFNADYGVIDQAVVESIYREAGKYMSELHHDWQELSEFVQNLRRRKQRFLGTELETLQGAKEVAQGKLSDLQKQESDALDGLLKSHEFNKALAIRAELEEKLKRLGSLEQDLSDIKVLKENLEVVDRQLQETKELIEAAKEELQGRVSMFNKYFSKLSELLYGEQYLLHFEETAKGSFAFQLSAVGANVGAGKKLSQTAAFDLAYVEFLKESGIPFPKFVCHDGIESIHSNQLAALLDTADAIDGQLVLATLHDKLPEMPDDFIERNTVLQLSQDDKLFRL